MVKPKPPKRFREPASVRKALLNAAEIEWRKRPALVSKHTTIAEACRAGFALTSEKGQHRFWGDVKRTAEASIGKDNPWAELNDDETPALPANIINFASRDKDTTHIAQAVEIETGAHTQRRRSVVDR